MNKKQIRNGLRFACFSVLCAILLSLSAFAAIPKAERVNTNGNGVGMFDEIGGTARNGARDADRSVGDMARDAGDAAGDMARDAGKAAKNAAKRAGEAIGDAASDAGNAVSDALDGAMDKDNGVISDGHAEDGHVDDSAQDHKDSGAVSDNKDGTDMTDTAKKDSRFNWIWIIILIIAAAIVLWLLLAPRKRNGV